MTITTTLANKQFSLLLLYFFTTWPILSYALVGSKYHIHIMNNLPLDRNNDLLVHCKSGDSDKGDEQLSLHQEYSWGTRINFFGTTLYHCELKWEGVNNKEISFVAFEAGRDGERCEVNMYCLWAVRDDGIYFSNDKSTWSNEYPW